MTFMSGLDRRRFGVGVVVGLAVWVGVVDLVGGPDVAAQSQPTPLGYTVEQASQGQSVYQERCASCHGEHMDDGEFGAPLKGFDFRRKWRLSSPEALFNLTRDTMPARSSGRSQR